MMDVICNDDDGRHSMDVIQEIRTDSLGLRSERWDPHCSPRFLSFRHRALKPLIFAQRDILLFLEGRKLKHRTSEVSSNHFVPTDREVILSDSPCL
eukprot:scaffold7133_cov119-Skeletonema_marinoi.AAC.1